MRAARVPQLAEQPLQPRLQRVRGLDPDVLRVEVRADYHEGAHRRALQENICIKNKIKISMPFVYAFINEID